MTESWFTQNSPHFAGCPGIFVTAPLFTFRRVLVWIQNYSCFSDKSSSVRVKRNELLSSDWGIGRFPGRGRVGMFKQSNCACTSMHVIKNSFRKKTEDITG